MYDPVTLTYKIDNTISISSVLKGDLLSIEIKPDRSTDYEIFENNLNEYVKSYGFNTLMAELCKAFQDVHNFDWYNDRCNNKDEFKRIPKQVNIEGIIYEEVIPQVQRTMVKWAEYHEASCNYLTARYKNSKIQMELSDLIESIKSNNLSTEQIVEEIKKIKEENNAR